MSDPQLRFLDGGGETAALVRSIDWSRSPLGPIASWPEPLKTTLGVMFHSPLAMFLWWGPELIQFYNDAYEPTLPTGKHPEAMGQRGRECWTNDWDRVGPQIAQVMERGESNWYENRLIPKLWNSRLEDAWWTYSYSPVLGTDGSVAGALVICLDKTREVLERRAAEAAHRATEAARARLGRVVAEAPAFVCALDGPDHVFSLANEPYMRLVGRRDLIGRKVREALPEVVEQGFVTLLDGVYTRNETFHAHEMHARLDRHGSGVPDDVFLEFVYSPRLDGEGQVEGIDVFGFEVTAQVHARRELQVLGESRRVMAEAIPQQVWSAMPDGALDFVNERVLAYFGATEEQVLGAGWQAVLHPDDLVVSLERWKHALETGEPYEIEFRLCRADGSYRWHLGRAVPLRDTAGTIYKWFGTNTDIDDHKRLRVELERQAEFQQQLLGIVSHDLRNPLQAIAVGAELLHQNVASDHPMASVIPRIRASAQRGGRMIRDLLDFTQARIGGGIPVVRARISLPAVVDQVVDEVRVAHPKRAITVLHEGALDGDWDMDRIAQVVSNLLSNAVHHGSQEQPIRILTRDEGAHASIEVHNFGAPIPESAMTTIFEPMRRASTGERGNRSIGLGLFIVREIVSAHGGAVTVRSTADDGTEFIVRLPRTPPKGS